MTLASVSGSFLAAMADRVATASAIVWPRHRPVWRRGSFLPLASHRRGLKSNLRSGQSVPGVNYRLDVVGVLFLGPGFQDLGLRARVYGGVEIFQLSVANILGGGGGFARGFKRGVVDPGRLFGRERKPVGVSDAGLRRLRLIEPAFGSIDEITGCGFGAQKRLPLLVGVADDSPIHVTFGKRGVLGG